MKRFKTSFLHYSGAYLLLAFSIIHNNYLRAQEYGFKNYTVADGLASSTVYCIEKDLDGRLFFATPYGVTIYNGNTFETIGKEDGLEETEVVLMYNDSKNRMWLLTFSNDLFYCQNQRIVKIKISDEIRRDIGINYLKQTKNIKEDKDGVVWLSGSFVFYIKDDSLYQVKKNRLNGYNVETDGNSIYFISRSQKVKIKDNKLVSNSDSIDISEKRFGVYRGACKVNNQYYFHSNSSIEIVEYDQLGFPIVRGEYSFLHPINRIKYSNNKVSILTNGQGAFQIDMTTNDTTHFFNKKSITDIITDNENNMWFSTINEGIYKINVPFVSIYKATSEGMSNNFLSIEKNSKDEVYAGTSNGYMYHIFDNKTDVINLNKNSNFSRILNLMNNKEGTVYACSDDGLFKYDEKKGLSIKILDTLGAAKSVLIGNDKHMYFSNAGNFLILEPNGSIRQHLKNGTRVSVLCHFNKNNVLVGTLEGIYFANKDSVKLFQMQNYRLDEKINFLAKYKKIVAAATQNSGLFLFDGKRKIQITTKNGLLSDACKHVYFDEATNNIWICTNRGINKIESIDFEKNSYSISNFTTEDGLPSDEVNQLTIVNNKVWVATSNGIAVFEKDYLQKKNPPHIFISSVTVQDSTYRYPSRIELPYWNNSIDISYEGISIAAGERIFYKYRVLGKDKNWISTKNHSIRFASLDPGKYVFQIEAINPKGNIASKMSELIIQINQPFWKTSSFIFFICSVFGALIYYISKRRLRTIRHESELKNQLLQSEIKSIRSQMNPHFIFNSLNSIQNFIFKNEKEIANEYLASFSKLMRLVLDNSNKNSVTLSKEIEFLDLYLTLENLRLNNKFNFQVEVDPMIEPSITEIPTMIIQPLVENAIIHGITKKEGKGNISIKFSGNDQTIICMVEDDGLGMKKDADRIIDHVHKHQSFGIKGINERIEILNHMKQFKIEMFHIDLKDDHGFAAGTSVKIIIHTILQNP